MKQLAMLLVICLVATALPVFAVAEDGVALHGGEDLEIAVECDGEIDPDAFELDPEADVLAGELSLSDLLEDDEAFSNGEYEVAGAPEWDAALTDGAESAEVAPAEESSGEDDGQPEACEVDLGVGEQYAMEYTLPEGATGKATLASDDESVVTVSEGGLVETVAVGDARVTVSLEGSEISGCLFHVRKAPDKVSFAAKSLTVGKGETAYLPEVIVGSVAGEYAGSYTLSSTDSKIVKVVDGCRIKGVKKGAAKIKVTTYNGRTATCKVTVSSAPGKVTASVDKKKLGVGEKGQISAELPKNTASTITYSSMAPEIVSVDPATGRMQGVAEGKTRVCAETFNHKKSYVTVTVAPAPQSVAFPEDAIRLGVGMKLAPKAALDDGAAGEITYTVEDKAVASLSGGKLKGVAKGETVVVARTYNGLEATCPVQVVAAPKKVTLPTKTLSIGVKEEVVLRPDVGDSASTYTYSSSNKKIATVTSEGVVRGVKKGSTTITVKTYNKKKVKLKVKVVKAPGSVKLSPSALELAVQETGSLKPVFPKDTSAGVTYKSSDPAVASVDPGTGAVTGVAPGTAKITATTHNGKKAKATVTVFAQPEWVDLDVDFIELAQEQTRALQVSLSPESRSPLTFKSADIDVAKVSKDGVITGVGAGSTVISVQTNVPEVSAQVSVTVVPAPDSVKLSQKAMTLNAGETTALVPIIPEGTMAAYSYESSDPAVATISEEGSVVAVSRGVATLTVTTHNGKKAELKLTVEDPWFPDKITLVDAPDYLKAGKSAQLHWTVEPAEAVADLKWKSSNEAVVTVDDTGLLKAVGYGYATISATSARNSAITLSFTLGVETDAVTLEIPARTTGVDGIAANLAKIDAIRVAAINQIELMKSGGVISKTDAGKREKMVNNAFKDYAFPWMTLKKQKYWKKANSEGGAKDFKPDRVYYGMPYISGAMKNREYNVAKALKEKRYTDSGEGYYLLNQKKLLSGKYCGNDCSCFVDAAIWGTSSGHSNDRTAEIAKSSAYKTVKDYKNLRTGDLICLGGRHVVMFLYFVNADKTKMMIIENGGIEAGTNTVHCMVMKTKWYTSRGYKVRRLKSLG